MSGKPFLLSTLVVTSALFGGNGYDGRFDMYAGWRQDDFNWSIQGPLGDPNVFAELDWQENEMVMFGGRGYLAGWDKIYIRAQGDYGKILQSKPIYSVYAFNDREGLFSRSEGCETGKRVFDYKAAIGFHLLPNCGPFDIAFVAGYAFQSQTWRLANPRIVVSPLTDIPFTAQGTYLRQMTHWTSGFLGIDATWNLGKCWSLSIEGEFHYAAYKGRGQWFWQEPDFELFLGEKHQRFDVKWRDCASGMGQVISGAVNYSAGQGWYFGLIGGFQRFWTREGNYTVDFLKQHVNPALDFAVTFPSMDATLNKIVWRSFYICFNIESHF